MDKRVVLKKPPQGALRFGHPWVYRSQIKSVSDGVLDGDIVALASDAGKFLGVGYYNSKSEISVRLLTRHHSVIDKQFLQERIQAAFEFRKRCVRDTNAYRLVSSEADDLPGLIVDRYGDVLVVQFLTLGMERLRLWVIEALEEVLQPKGIYERSDSTSRRLEGLLPRAGWIHRACGDSVTVLEMDIAFGMQFGEGHKTGFYLDQRDNRLLLRAGAKDQEVLDAFCYEGAFGLHLARAGCRVTGIDISEDAIFRACEHRDSNGIPKDRLDFRVGNVFDELKNYEKEKRRFDLIILDPPSFVKKKSALEGAVSGFKEIVLRSMKLLEPSGRLAVFSCSYHVNDDVLMQVAMSAAADTRKNLRVLHFMKQSSDHPINPFIPETYYLKGFLFEVS